MWFSLKDSLKGKVEVEVFDFPCIIQLQSVQRRPHLSPHRQIYNKNGINLRSADGRNRYIPQSATRVPPQQAKLAHDQTKHTITILKKWAIPMRRKNPHALKKACGLLRREVTELTDGRGMQHMEIPLRRYKRFSKAGMGPGVRHMAFVQERGVGGCIKKKCSGLGWSGLR